MRLIDADAIIRDFPCAADDWSSMLIRKALDDAPTVGQKKGEWVPKVTTSDIIICSLCKNEAYWDTDYGQQLFEYCPYCGADMRGDK